MLHIAPIQGHTDAAWRNLHFSLYGGNAIYYTPFIRLERGDIRKRDRADAFSDMPEGMRCVPQVIFKNHEELHSLVSILSAEGAAEINLNLGCPFPLQTARGRGAAAIASQAAREAVKEVITSFPDVRFSVKMRLGMQDPQEWRPMVALLNELPVEYLAVHPRVARQQYGGETDIAMMRALIGESDHPVVYNGDILTPSDAVMMMERYPEVKSLMIGRGVLARPSLAVEIANGEEWPREKRIRRMLGFHDRLFEYYSANLQGGEHQVLDKIRPFWEYAEAEIGRKAWKAIRKASTLPKYHTALALIDPAAIRSI